ncbi:MAG: CoA-binding protein [Kiritimatiellaeota bacterium]|nr:CoA-binding protein [Kiritimatiellota bacterium]
MAVVLGASPKTERYSNMAVALLLEKGFNVIPVNPAGAEIHGLDSVKSLDEIGVSVEILTMYVNAKRSSEMTDLIFKLRPGKVIFNPGAENDELAAKLADAGIKTENACTLILLNTGQLTAE